MALTPGTRLGPYEVVGSLGEGGMGQVYRAHDTQLGRDVAIKVLPEAFATDADRLARFEREARTLAALNHPNIAHIYGLTPVGAPGATAGAALVMELVEGDDLSAHVARGPMPVAEVLPIASQLADALEAAHEQAIVHRDLKPANIKLRPDGTVKVLDFGLAKALDPAGTSGADAMHSPTMTARATAMGMILGTAAYMSPEQAKGRSVDKRADIWAFGVVLYEMLTGRRAFAGDDVTETLASVIRDTPDLDALPAGTPRRLRQIIERCLIRDPKLRLRDIGEARIELTAIAGSAAGVDGHMTAPASAPPARLRWLTVGAVAGIVVGAVTWLVAGRRSPAATETSAVARFQTTLPPDVQLAPSSLGTVSISPDGQALAFVAQKGTILQLWLRALDSNDAKPLPGTDNAILPFWSPDAGHVAFFAAGKLKRIDLRTNAVTTLCDAPDPGGGTWNEAGVIVFSPMVEGPLYRVSAGGGTPAPLTTLDQRQLESNHMWPHFLPDGRHYLFQVLGLTNSGIYVGTLDGTDRTLVLRQDTFDLTAVQYSSSGHVVYVRNHQLVARPFDLTRLRVSGDEVTLAEGFGIGGPGVPAFGVSRTGVLVFRPIGARASYQPTWFSRNGAEQGALGTPGPYGSMDLSRDGSMLALDQFTEKESSIRLLDVARGTTARFAADTYSVGPAWFPAGDRLAYVSVRDTPPNPFVRTLAGVETRLARLPWAVVLGSVAPDGRTIIGDFPSAVATREDLWLFSTTPETPPKVFLQTPYAERQARISPDGRWVAFTSDESGRNEIYLTTFPEAGQRFPVSTDRGVQARWSADSRELLFRSGDRIMAAQVTGSAAGDLALGTPRLLFTLPEGAGSWTATGDGQRFLVNKQIAKRETAPITVVINWPSLVRGPT